MEVLITVGILATVSALGLQIMEKGTRRATFQQAETEATQTSEQLARMIARDVMYRVSPTAVVVSSSGLSLRITRTGLAQANNSAGTYQVTYTSGCRALAGFDTTGITASCVAKLACRPNESPYVSVTVAPIGAVTLPHYPGNAIPLLLRNAASAPKGTAACFMGSTSQLRVTVQTLFRKENGAVDVAAKDGLYSLEKTAYGIVPSSN